MKKRIERACYLFGHLLNIMLLVCFMIFMIPGENYSDASDEQYTKPSKLELKEQLTPLQYSVTQEDGTERSFDNEYWNNKREGIYVDIVSGEPLFSSTDKFKSGTGWPSFTRPLVTENIVEKEDDGFFMTRTEVTSRNAD